jgi:hypothetical protein
MVSQNTQQQKTCEFVASEPPTKSATNKARDFAVSPVLLDLSGTFKNPLI